MYVDMENAYVADIYKHAYLIFKQMNNQSEAETYLFKYLKSIDSDLQSHADYQTFAVTAVLSAFNSSSLNNLDVLLSLQSVQKLQQSNDYKCLYELLNIFIYKNVQEYITFYEANKASIAKYGLDATSLLSHIRTLTLCTLANANTNNSFSYAQIQESLMLSYDDKSVEEVVIESIICNKLDCKIDDANQSVHIIRSSPRSFTTETWNQLYTQLNSYKYALNVMCDNLHKVQNKMKDMVDQEGIQDYM